MADTLTADGELTYASFPIERVEQTADGHVMVWGKATDDSVDSDEQIVDPKFAAKAIDEWMASGPNVRVQHQAQRDPAGVGVSVDRDGSAQWVKSKIIEPVAKQLVLGGALRAYSVGIARPTIVRDNVARGGRITGGQIVEISLVDRPANKNCGIQLVKAAKDGTPEWVGKAWGTPVLEKTAGSGDVTLTLPRDVQMSFSPLDMARLLNRKHTGNDEGIVEKKKLTTGSRDALSDSDFVFPADRRYPIHDESHARNALARVSQHGTPEEKAKVRAAVRRRYPGIAQGGGKKKAVKSDSGMDSQVWAHLEDALNAIGEASRDQAMDMDMGDSKKKRRKAMKAAARAALAGLDATISKHPDDDDDEVDKAGTGTLPQSMAPKQGTGTMPQSVAPAASTTAKDGTGTLPQSVPHMKGKKMKAACMACGAKQNALHAYCSECGKTMIGAPEVAKNHDYMCLGCGKELDKGERFCPECGKENPGYNPMADLKIPANKTEGSRVTADTIDKGKMPRKKGKKGKGKGTGMLRDQSLPAHVFDPDSASKSADLAISTSMRLKNLGIGADMGYAHDLTCPAFSWEDVSKAYPAGLDNLNADEWQRKALDAASSAPLAQAQAASRLGQAVFTIKTAAPGDLVDVKSDINKAFRDANPGPGAFPTPGHIAAQSFKRPKITAGRAAYAHQYDEHGISARVPEGQISADNYERPYIHDGRAEASPANKAGRNVPKPSPNGVPMNLDYSDVHKEQILQAFTAMHDHFDRVFPGVCPMNAPASKPPARPFTVKVGKGKDAGFEALTEAVIALPDTIKGEVVNALAGQPADADRPALDREAITEVLRKSQKTSDKRFAALTDAVSILAEQAARPPAPGGPPQSALDQKAVAAVLRKTQKASDKRFLALTEAVSALPGTIREEVANALPGTPEAAQPAFDHDAVVAVLSKAQKTSDKRFLKLTKAVNALPGVLKGATAGEVAVKPDPDPDAVAAVLRKAQKTSDKRFLKLTKAVNALPGAIKDKKLSALTMAVNAVAAPTTPGEPANPAALDQKTIAAVLRKAQKTSDRKIEALTKAMTATPASSAPSAPDGPAKSGLDRKTVAAVLRKAQKTSDKRFAALTSAVNALADPPAPAGAALDRKAVAALLRKARKESDEKITALTAAVNALADRPSPVYRSMPLGELPATPARTKPSRPADAKVTALRKAQKESDEKLMALTKAVNVLAAQPDPATQAFKGMAVNPLRTKSAGPAGVQSMAEIAERTQTMMLHELEAQWRNSTDPVQREAAWNASLKMRGLLNGNGS